MKALYALYASPAAAQRAFDLLRSGSSELGFDPAQIVILSGEPHDGYEFADRHSTSSPYHWTALGAFVGGTLGYLLTTLTQKSYPIVTGGMPLAPLWTNGIIVYECFMLGAILTTLVHLFIGAKLPSSKPRITDPEIGTGKILVGVEDPPENSRPELERRLRQAGASLIKQFP